MLLMNLIPTNMETWSALTKWDFNEVPVYVVSFIRVMTANFCALVVIESSIIRYFAKIIWKRIPPINHEFIVIFLTILNIIISVTTGIISLMAGNLK